MSKRNAFLVLLLVISTFADSYAQGVPAPTCVPVPGIPCPGSYASSGSSISMNTAIKQQMAADVAGIFVQWLFSSNAQAAAQKQQMMAELEHRKAEAERLHKMEEAKRLEAICNRLSAALKLSGLPDLQLKGASAGGLQLKLGDESSGRVGVRGLPGIALNDNTGNGGTTPYGISGLTGIYTNGPAFSSSSTSSGESKLQLKTDDEIAPPAQVASGSVPATGTGPANVDAVPADLAAAMRDPQSMTPQQLADAVTLVSQLPAEEQQRLMNAAAAASQGTNNAAPTQAITSAAPNGPVLSQLQKTAHASQSAAVAKSPEDAAVLAGAGFDQALHGTTVPTPTGTPVATLGPSPTTARPVSPATPASPTTPHAVPIPVISLATGTIEPKSSSATNAAATTKPLNGPACPAGVERIIPSRQQLLSELAVRRSQLESLRNTVTRLNRTIQIDQQQFAVWQEEAEAGWERVRARRLDLTTGALFDSFVESKEKVFEDLENQRKLTAFDQEQWRRLKLAKDIKSFDDFRKWALENKSNREMMEEGARMLIDYLPLQAEAMSYVRCGKDLIDSLYDFTALHATWENVQQLDRNSNQFLESVQQNGERMKTLVQRIQQIQIQLNSTPEGQPNASPCRDVQAPKGP